MADSTSAVGTTNYVKYEDTITRESKGDSLGKEDFLKLLVTQLTNQDPTNPMNDTEFVTQLATYSGLEQQITMNKNLETLIAANTATTAASAVSLIGKVVGYLGEDGQVKAGMVSFLDIVDGEVNLYLTDGTYVPFSKVEQIGSYYAGTGEGTSETPETPEDSDTPETTETPETSDEGEEEGQ
ncbi:MAG: flagellar hook assembly protein FlgD [Synergistaceae bacterium]|jgi:flagellar basal-body rod modification protein FlgD|nr:flagellar hook assembly protein FlgD [Synergistaceae bacterium]